MIIDAHAYITSGFHGQTRSGPTRSLPYGRIKHGDAVVQVLPPLSAEKTALEPETMLRLMDWACIDRVVLLQSPFYGDHNTLHQQAIKRWPDRFTAAAFVDPCDDQAHRNFRRATQDLGMRILSLDISEKTGLTGLHPDMQLEGEQMAWYWEQAEQLGMTVAINLGRIGTRSYQTDALQAIVQRHPRAKFVITCLAHPPLADPQDQQSNTQWQQQVMLAKETNVWLDTAGLPALGVQDYPFPTALKYILLAVELVGADKIMWGSDVPSQLCHATYPQLVNLLALHSRLNDYQLEKILGSNANEVYLST